MTASIVARLNLARDDFTLDVDLHLPGRTVFRLPNPELSPEAPTDKFWWDDLAAELAAPRYGNAAPENATSRTPPFAGVTNVSAFPQRSRSPSPIESAKRRAISAKRGAIVSRRSMTSGSKCLPRSRTMIAIASS